MIKREEIVAHAEKMMAAQAALNKYVEHYTLFLKEPRCKKGIQEFLKELFNLAEDNSENKHLLERWNIDYSGLMVRLGTGKCNENSWITRDVLQKAGIETRGFEDLTELRVTFSNLVADYVLHVYEELGKSELTDARERQVYLRRAIARLVVVTFSKPLVPITAAQWPEVEPYEYCDYLSATMEEMVKGIRLNQDYDYKHVAWGPMNFEHREAVKSILNFLDYLDTFLTY